MPRFLIHHQHQPQECGIAYASFKGCGSSVRHLPAIAGFDFSPLVLLLLLQVAGMLLGGLQGEVLRSLL